MAAVLPALCQDSAQHSLSFSDTDYCRQFMRRMTHLRDTNQYTDVILKTGALELSCHRVVLAAASEYFHGMFTSGLEEATSGVIEIKGTDSETMSALLEYIYSADIQITTDNVESLVQASEQFQFKGLKLACEDFMLPQIGPTNCIGFYKFAKLYSLKRLRERARKTMLTRFLDVVRLSEFQQLTVEDVEEYISDDRLDVPNEDTVYEAVSMWVKANENDRHAFFPRIVARVRLPFCSSMYLCCVVAMDPAMADADCQLYLEEARMYHMLPDHRHEICSTRTAPRKCFPIQRCLVVVGGLTKEDRQNRYSWYLKSEDSTWELLAQLPQPNWKFYSVCVIQNGILVTGGFHNDVKRDTWLFDTVEKKWKFMPPMREGRCKHSSVVHNGNVFVIGGEDVDDCPLESVEQFDLRLRQWSRAPSMPKPLSHPLAVSYGQHIYVMSGIEDGEATSLSMLAFDAIWGDWEYRAEMPRPCRLGAGATVNDHIYVVGGLTRSCMSYSPSSDTWTTLNLPREKHGNAPAVVWKGKILVGGGDVDSSETTSVVEEYDPVTDAWSYWSLPLKEELSCHHLLNVDLYNI